MGLIADTFAAWDELVQLAVDLPLALNGRPVAVYRAPTDSPTPPAVMLGWPTVPLVEAADGSLIVEDSAADVHLIAGRVDRGDHARDLFADLADQLLALWVPHSGTACRHVAAAELGELAPFDVGGVAYLSAVVALSITPKLGD